nr:GAF and ANTAR domain-containing protein [Kibdelosporangium sp. MJ126-NF4]CEL15426.1 hypothetical protein [Kibdelosporangium sp. MJ126-NF4]CTQ92170.1 hypothetical protein [Kibdelosporangium sp. MJ126-NF4]
MLLVIIEQPTKAVRVPDERLVRVMAYLAEHAAVHGAVVSSRLACDAVVRLVEASGAGLTLMSGTGHGELRYATDEVSGQLEAAQFTLGEGPGVEAFQSAAPVLVADLDTDAGRQRWPLFTPAAVGAGAGAVFAFPLRIGAVRLGVLLLHRTRLGPLASEQVADALVIADIILSMVLDELTPGRGERAGDGIRLRQAEIHQATGMVSVQLAVTMEEALVRLRAYSFAAGRPISEVARDVVARRLRMDGALEGEAG